MDIDGSIALVTGAAGGLGRSFVRELKERGASKVYATGRDVTRLRALDAEPLHLDLLDPASIERAAEVAGDVTLLINNAGVSTRVDLLTGDLDTVRREMDTNFFGTLQVTRAFAGILGRNGGGAIVNLLSALSFYAWPGVGAYSASKSAAWILTNATRTDLAAQGTSVLGVALGAADTEMMAGYEGPMLDPVDVARRTLDAVEAGTAELLLDDWTRMAKAGVAEDPVVFAAKVAAVMGG